MVEIIHHKCNSLYKIKKALELGTQGIEFDVICTKDNVPVLWHDRFLRNRLVLLPEEAREIPLELPVELSILYWDEIQELRPDICSLAHIYKKLEKIPSYFTLNLEIKQNIPEVTDKILFVLDKFPELKLQTTIRSFHEDVLLYVKKKQPDIKLIMLCGIFDDEDSFKINNKIITTALPSSKQIKKICNYASYYYKDVNEEYLKSIRKSDIKTEVYTVNDINDAFNELDFIVTDKPEIFLVDK